MGPIIQQKFSQVQKKERKEKKTSFSFKNLLKDYDLLDALQNQIEMNLWHSSKQNGSKYFTFFLMYLSQIFRFTTQNTLQK